MSWSECENEEEWKREHPLAHITGGYYEEGEMSPGPVRVVDGQQTESYETSPTGNFYCVGYRGNTIRKPHEMEGSVKAFKIQKERIWQSIWSNDEVLTKTFWQCVSCNTFCWDSKQDFRDMEEVFRRNESNEGYSSPGILGKRKYENNESDEVKAARHVVRVEKDRLKKEELEKWREEREENRRRREAETQEKETAVSNKVKDQSGRKSKAVKKKSSRKQAKKTVTKKQKPKRVKKTAKKPKTQKQRKRRAKKR